MTRLCLALLVAATLLSTGCADWLLIHGSRRPRVVRRAERRLLPAGQGDVLEVVIRRFDRRGRLLGRHPRGEGAPRLFVLEFTGNAGRAERGPMLPAAAMPRAPFEHWRVNYPGFGRSSGRASLQSVPWAALVAFDAIEVAAGGRPVWITGNSLGCTAALWVARERPGRVAAVAIKNPPPLRELVLRRYGWWGLWLAAIPVALQIPHALDVLKSARRARAPALVFTSAKDRLVPPDYQRRVYQAYLGPKRLVVLPGAGHNTGLGRYRARARRGLRWLATMARKARSGRLVSEAQRRDNSR